MGNPKRRISLLYAGGTMGMKNKDPRDPESPLIPGTTEGFMEHVDIDGFGGHGIEVVQVKSSIINPPNIIPRDCIEIAERVYAGQAPAVVIAGTDIQSYVTTALSFLLDGLPFPVVVTDSFSPISDVQSNARNNLATAICIAAGWDIANLQQVPNIPESCILYDRKRAVLRGNRSLQVHSDGILESRNYPSLAITGRFIEVDNRFVLPDTRGPYQLHNKMADRCAVWKEFVSDQETMRRTLKQVAEDLRYLVIDTHLCQETAKNLPPYYDIFREAEYSGLTVALASQQGGGVTRLQRPVRQELERLGIILMEDMMPTTALVKGQYLFGRYGNQSSGQQKIRELLPRNLRGEVTGPLVLGA